MAASIIPTRRGKNRATKLVLPRDADSRAFLEEVGFTVLFDGGEPRPGTLDLRQMTALHASYTQQVVDLLADRVPGAITSENGYPIQLCLNELLQNVFEWSLSPPRFAAPPSRSISGQLTRTRHPLTSRHTSDDADQRPRDMRWSHGNSR